MGEYKGLHTYGDHGEVEWEEVSPGEEAGEDVEAAHVDTAVQGQQHEQAPCVPYPRHYHSSSIGCL